MFYTVQFKFGISSAKVVNVQASSPEEAIKIGGKNLGLVIDPTDYFFDQSNLIEAIPTGEEKDPHWQVVIKSVAPGEYIKRKADAKTVYIKGAYDRATKSFECTDVEDINRHVYIKADKPVFIGFTY